MRDLAAVPLEVLGNLLAQLPPCEAIQLQRVSRSFRRAAAPNDELADDVAFKLLAALDAEGQSEHDALVACAARRWLAHHAAGVKFFSIEDQGAWYDAAIPACASLVSCLPALESARLQLPGPLAPGNVGCLLEALASRPALTTLELIMMREYSNWHRPDPLGCAPAFAKLRSLTKLALFLCDKHPYTLAEVVGALVSLTSLTDLFIRKDCSDVSPPEMLPAALGQLKGLQTLCLEGLKDCVMDAGCLDLPNLQCLRFPGYNFYYDYEADEDAQLLPSVTTLQSLTSIDLSDSDGPPCFAQLVNLPRLQRMDFSANESLYCLGLSMLPADMGSLCLTLKDLDVSGRGLTQFPLALTRLGALECLKASANEFAEVPPAITALLRLTKLTLGRAAAWEDPLQLHDKRPLDVRALGDLSAFPALRELSLSFCEAVLCDSMLGAVRHARLASLVFHVAHPAPGCAPMVLKLSQALRRQMRGSVLRLVLDVEDAHATFLRKAQGQAAFHKFRAALQAFGQ